MKTALFLLAASLTVSAAAASDKVIIAHRGASGYLPEHTLEAVAMAHAMGADFLEPDVVLSKDGVPMVLHDISIESVTDVATRFPGRKHANGRYYAIDFTLAELKQLRATERFDPKSGKPVFPERFPMWQASFQIPTLEEEIQLVQGLNKSTHRNAGVYPEIKAPAWHRQNGQDISRIMLELLARYGYRTKTDNFYLQCFENAEVKRVRNELGFKGKLVQLIGRHNLGEDPKSGGERSEDNAKLLTAEGLQELARYADGIGPGMQLVVSGRTAGALQISDVVKNAHAAGLVVHPYSLRADSLPGYAKSMDELFRIFFVEANVDGVFTDFPDTGAAFLRTLRERK
jgi:glycerophosphoryl diester phosphodiesterase